VHTEALNLREVVVFLVAAGLLVPFLHRLKVSPVLGFLGAGLMIGPYGLARFAGDWPWLGYVVIAEIENVRALAELGVMFLLFMIGLELSLDRLWAMRRSVFGMGGVQVVVTGAAVALIASLFDNSRAAAMVLGAAFALSSTAIVLQILTENRRLGTNVGQTTFAVLLFQDLAVLPILLLVGIIGAGTDGSEISALATAFGVAVLAIAVILVLGRIVIRPLFRFVGSRGSREMFLAAVLLVIIATAAATQQAGLSLALGAFLAGLLFSETEYRHQIEVDIEPFKGLLLGLFFVSIGMGVDLGQLVTRPFWLIASVIGLFAVKGVIFYAIARVFGRPHAVALESALLLGQGGEFAFLIIGLGTTGGLIPPDTAQFMLIVAGLTMVATPFVASLARRIAATVERDALQGALGPEASAKDLAGHVVVVGYGRVGQMLGEILDAQEISHVALDLDTGLVADFAKSGACVFYGDARQGDILRKVGVDRAAALVVTMDNATAAEHVVTTARRNCPDLPVYARARDGAHAARLSTLGATHVIPETIEASLQLSELVLIGAGVPDNAARQLIESRRQLEQTALDEGLEENR
jgi:CPA2 family monovalent cation:H+ antiporter-2